MALIKCSEHVCIQQMAMPHIDFQFLLKSVNWLHVSSN